VLTSVALAVNLVAYLGAFAMGAIDSLYLIGALLPPEQRDVAAIVIDKMWSSGIPGSVPASSCDTGLRLLRGQDHQDPE
jgi:hypothetical protein